MSFTTPLGCAAKAGWDARSWIGSLIGVVIGVLVGLFSIYITARELMVIQNHKELSKPNLVGPWQLLLICIMFFLFLQVLMTAFLSMWSTERCVTLLFGS